MRSRVVDDDVRAAIEGMEHRSTASFATTEAFEVRGVVNPSARPYRLKVARDSGGIVYTLTGGENEATGKIKFVLPSKYIEFVIDTRREDGQRMLSLYWEWRLDGAVSLEGIFAKATKTAKAQLIFHATNNNCTEIRDAYAWTLIVKGNGADFTLIGRFGPDSLEEPKPAE